VIQYGTASPCGLVKTTMGRNTKGSASPSFQPDSAEMACLRRSGRLRSATPPVTIVLATTGSVGVNIAPRRTQI
jgi:hypothetical protein